MKHEFYSMFGSRHKLEHIAYIL